MPKDGRRRNIAAVNLANVAQVQEAHGTLDLKGAWDRGERGGGRGWKWREGGGERAEERAEEARVQRRPCQRASLAARHATWVMRAMSGFSRPSLCIIVSDASNT